MGCSVTPESFEKAPFEKEQYSFDFAPIMASDETINSSPIAPVVSSLLSGGGTSDLTITDEQIDGQTVEFFIAGGTHARRYKITCRIYTSTGRKLELDGIIKIRE